MYMYAAYATLQAGSQNTQVVAKRDDAPTEHQDLTA
jgi:hypothetical protein